MKWLIDSLLAGVALILVVVMHRLLPAEVLALQGYVFERVGPTSPFLAGLAAYALVALGLAALTRHPGQRLALLRHAKIMGGLTVTMGMIGTYLALQASLGDGVPSPELLSHALVSTLVGLVVSVIVAGLGELLEAGEIPGSDEVDKRRTWAASKEED